METNFSASLLQPECVEERDALSPSTQATSIHCSQLITQPGQRLCECGKGAALLGLPIGSATARWCPLCPNKAWNAIKRCDCRRKKARFGLPYQELKDARWCADCPSKPVEAVNLEELAAAARVAAADAARAATSSKIDESSKPCVCGKSLATLALPIQAKLARWCPDCPDRPRNAIPVAGRCSCGRRKATLGMPDDGPEGAKWCPHCPDKPDGYEVVVQLLPIQDPKEFPGPRAGRYTQPPPAPVEPGPCVCGRTTATLALPIQLWLAKWCPDCPERPRNAVDVAFRCECGRRKASLGLPGQGTKWCIYCPNKPEQAVQNPDKLQAEGGETSFAANSYVCQTISNPGMEDALPVQSDARQFSEMCVCGSGLATLALPMQSDQAGKWCPLCPDLPRNAIPVTALCQCGKNHASLGLLEDASKGLKAAIWCPDCPDVPPHVINFKKRPCP